MGKRWRRFGHFLLAVAELSNRVDPSQSPAANSAMTLTIYGSPRSRTMRVLWIAAELGLEYTHVPLAFDDPALKEPAFLRINPAGAIPAIIGDGFALTESLAINLYLAKKYGSGGAVPLYPSTAQGEAEAWRWSLWAQGHLEPWVQRRPAGGIARGDQPSRPGRGTSRARQAGRCACRTRVADGRPLYRL